VDNDVISSLVDLSAARDVTPIILYRLSVFIQLAGVLQKPMTIETPARVSTSVPISSALQVIFADTFVHIEHWRVGRE
jgi:hypothetical protein